MGKEHHIYIYEPIDSFWGYSSKQMIAEIADARKVSADSIVLHINSPGGSVFEGFAIYNLLKDSGLTVTAKVEGVCASIATLIALAANEIHMARNSQFMIHNPSMEAGGDAAKMKQAADILEKIESQLISAYVIKTGKPEDEIREKMAAETWFTADEAVAYGFADSVTESLKIAAIYDKLNSIKMKQKDNKVLSAIDGLLAKIKAEFANPTNGMMKLKDAETILYFEGELVEEGKKVYTDEAMTVPAPEGDHMLEDDKMITVGPDGTVVRVLEPTASTDEQLATLTAENEQLKNQIETMNAQIAEMQNKHQEALNTLVTEVENLKTLALGEPVKVKATAAVSNEAKSKTKASPSAWDSLADNIKKNFVA
jgi:ATP-dependent Clp endopeptidase proteolytic subunit ClpP